MTLGEAIAKTSKHYAVRSSPISGIQFIVDRKWKRINDISDVYPFKVTISSQHFQLKFDGATFIYNGFGSRYWRHIKGETFEEFLQNAITELNVDIIFD